MTDETDIEAGKAAFFDWLDQHIDQRVAADLAAAAPPRADPPPVVELPPVVVPPVDPVPPVIVSPPPPPAKDGFRVVNGRQVPLGLQGVSINIKGAPDIATVLATLDRIEGGMYQPGHGADIVGCFIGLGDPQNISKPGFSIPAETFSALNKRGKWVMVSYPTVPAVNPGPDRFTRVIAGADDAHHRLFARWAKDSGAKFILRMGWERDADWMPHGGSDKQGTHFPPADVIAAHHHVIDVLDAEAPGLFLYSDSHFRVPFLGNGAKVPRAFIDPATIALDPRKVHMVGADIYSGGWSAKQTIAQYFDYPAVVGGKQVPNSLMTWGRWAKARGLPLSVDEWGIMTPMTQSGPDFIKGFYQRVTHDLQAEGVDVAATVYFHKENSKLVGVKGVEDSLAAYRSTFGGTG